MTIQNQNENTFFIREVRVNYHSTGKPPFKIRHSDDVLEFIQSVLTDNSREHFIALYLDGSHSVCAYSLIAIGTANSCQMHPREIFQRAILCGAVSLVIAHNHPSNDLTPSAEDKSVTRRVKDCASLLGMKLLDSIILTNDSSVSLMDELF